MTTSAEVLYHNASEKSFLPYLDIQEHNRYEQTAEQAENSIRELLPPERMKLLDELSQARNFCASIELEAAFQAGLAIGLELSRL